MRLRTIESQTFVEKGTLAKKGTLKVYKGAPHGMCTAQREEVNPDLLAVLKE